jgi:hypothetical protein
VLPLEDAVQFGDLVEGLGAHAERSWIQVQDDLGGGVTVDLMPDDPGEAGDIAAAAGGKGERGLDCSGDLPPQVACVEPVDIHGDRAVVVRVPRFGNQNGHVRHAGSAAACFADRCGMECLP